MKAHGGDTSLSLLAPSLLVQDGLWLKRVGGVCWASGKERRLMSKPPLQQETKLHKDSRGGTASGFLPSGPWSRKKPGA